MSDIPADKKPDSPAAKRPRKGPTSAGSESPASAVAAASAPAAESAAAEAPAAAVEPAAGSLAAPPAIAPQALEAGVGTPKTKAAPAASASEATEAVSPTTQAGAKTAAGPAQKGTTFMATEKVQAIFGDLNERAKAAVEKSSKLVEDLADLTKGNVEAFVTSSRVAAKGAEALGQEAVDYGKKSFETATATFKSLAGAKSPSELYQLQSDYAKTAFDSAIAEASKVSEQIVKLAGDIFQPISSRYAVAVEKLKASAL